MKSRAGDNLLAVLLFVNEAEVKDLSIARIEAINLSLKPDS